jgi:hypothetical protein
MRPYFQSTSFTTAASAMLTIIHNFNQKIELTKEKEFDVWQKTVNLPTRASSIFALANYAKQNGLNPKVIVEKKEYDFPDYRFYRYTKEDVDQAAFSDELHFQNAEKNNVQIIEKEINLEEIKKELIGGKVVLLRLNTKPIRNLKRNTSNYIVAHGFSDDYFHIVDPAFSAFSIPSIVMQEAFESLETKKYRDHRMIIF